ncbi:MAG: hypothetical protein K2M37_01295 [Muribaculaceae bacterium]|nr:hypothetical protein [Muribaculaceae bacterium]
MGEITDLADEPAPKFTDTLASAMAIAGMPIPNIQSMIDAMIEKYRKETIYIEDVEFEEHDLEFDIYFQTKIIKANGVPRLNTLLLRASSKTY